jgi:oxygen-independent coproporphyrinogen-3 oxidase
VSEALDAARSIRATGLDLSIDLMCGIPGLSDETWVHTLEQAIATDAGHISVYPLTLEEGTPLAVACGTGLVDTPDPDRAADQMLRAEEILSSAGLNRYEVSNYARAGMESRHNLAYWTGRPYIGVGPAAHGMLETATATAVGMIDAEQAASAARVRYGQSPDIDGWLTGADPTIELLDAAEVGREDIMLGLRLTRGVSADAVSAAGVEAAVGELVDAGLVERYTAGAERYRTTQRGWLLGNEVFARIWEG